MLTYARHTVGYGDGGQGTAILESIIADARHAVGDGDGCQTSATFVFANDFISITCVLNGRKVTVKILKRLEIDEDLTFLTFLNAICNYLEIFATQLFDS